MLKGEKYATVRDKNRQAEADDTNERWKSRVRKQ